jgi:AcrR family transcriptional regulator
MTEKRGRGRPRREGADEEILEVAREMLREFGYRDLTVDLVAEHAGVAKTTVYRRWPTKGSLIAAALPHPPTPDSGALDADLIAALNGLREVLVLIGDGRSDPDVAHVVAPHRAVLESVLLRHHVDPLAADMFIGAMLVARELPETEKLVRLFSRGLRD